MGKKIQLTETELINLIEKMVKEYDKPAMASFQKQYGKKKGKSVYYATANKQKRNPETFKVKKLTEADLTRIVKRIINEDLALLGDTDSDEDDNLSDDEFMSKYKGKDLGWDAPTNRRLNRMRDIDAKRLDDRLSDEKFMSKYRGKDLGWDAPTNKKLERMRSIRNKK